MNTTNPPRPSDLLEAAESVVADHLDWRRVDCPAHGSGCAGYTVWERPDGGRTASSPAVRFHVDSVHIGWLNGESVFKTMISLEDPCLHDSCDRDHVVVRAGVGR